MFFAVLSKGVEVTRLKTLFDLFYQKQQEAIQLMHAIQNFQLIALNTVKLGLRFKVTQFASVMPNRLVSFYPMETSSAMSNRIWRNVIIGDGRLLFQIEVGKWGIEVAFLRTLREQRNPM
ncbi:NADPH oxidase activator [Trichinella pseudospiralis]|uniref:Uncharacterized protein n=1 Tax=Trichinella pseudospiralis TaxID=6337 RepID=A0A0V0XZW3_TRIPS|nr:hypothetical protein T4E_9687 [Trichinella pseudospiralis]